MLQAINDRIKGWLGALVIFLITIPFAFWGIESYLGGGGKQFAAVVNGEEIPLFQFEDAYSNQLARLNQQFGSQLPISNEEIKAQVLDQLINAVVLEENSYSSGYRVSDTNLKQSIATLFTRDGKFDRDFFENVVASNGMTISQYETRLRNELRVVQKQNAIVSSAILSEAEATKLAALEQQERDVRLVRIKADAQSEDIDITDQRIEEYYNSNIDKFMTPDRVSVEYVEVTADDLADSVAIDESRIEALYDDFKRTLMQKEERKARHILLQTGEGEDRSETAVMARMEEIQQKLADGQSFEDLAAEFSEDPGSAKQGGDLGWVSTGEMVKPFEDTLFGMNTGDISDIVKTQFGLHLIKLEDARTPEVPSYAEKRSEFEQELKEEVIGNMFYDVSDNMAVTAYENPDSLDAVAEAVNKQPAATGLFTRGNGAGIASNQKVRDAAFSATVLQDGLNSDIIEISPTHIVVLRLSKHEPASKRSLEDVKAGIATALRMQAAQDAAKSAAEAIKDRIVAGDPVEDTLAENQKVEELGALKRTDFSKTDPAVIQAAFQMPYPAGDKPSVQVVNLMSGDVAVLVLDRVATPAEIAADKINTVKQQRENDVANAEFDFALSTIKDAAEIQRNTELLQ